MYIKGFIKYLFKIYFKYYKDKVQKLSRNNNRIFNNKLNLIEEIFLFYPFD